MDNKKELNKLNDDPYVMPKMSGTMEHLKNESLMLFSYSMFNKKRYRLFYGIGVVYRVVKGEKQDLIYINFGMFGGHQPRLVVAYSNHARRQILTLKRGQVAQVYGICRYFTTDIMLNGKKTKGVKLGLYARARQGWYVQTMIDIRKMPVNDDLENPTIKEEQVQTTLEDILDDFLNGTGEEWNEIFNYLSW